VPDDPYINVRRGANVRWVGDCRHCGGMGEVNPTTFVCHTCWSSWRVGADGWEETTSPEAMWVRPTRLELLMGED